MDKNKMHRQTDVQQYTQITEHRQYRSGLGFRRRSLVIVAVIFLSLVSAVTPVVAQSQEGNGATEEQTQEKEAPDYVTQQEYRELQSKIANLEAAIQQKPNPMPVQVSASVSMGWYMDLNNLATGFTNEGTSSVTLTILPASSREGLARGDVVGYIQIQDFQIEMTTTDILGSTGALTAGIKGDDWDMQIWTVPQLTLSKARILEEGDTDIATTLSRSGGFAYTYDFRPVDMTVNFASGAPVTNNEANRYVTWADLVWKIKNNIPEVANFRAMPGSRDVFAIRFSGAYEANIGNPAGIGPEYPFTSRDIGAAIEPVLILADVGYGLVASVAADMVVDYLPPRTDPDTSEVLPEEYKDPEFDFRGDVRLNLSPSVLMGTEEKRTYLAAAAYYNLTDNDLDIELSGEELQGTDGAIETVSGEAVIGLYDLLDDFYWGIDGRLEYEFEDVTPFVGAEYYSNDDLLDIDLGVDLEVIPRVKFTAAYESEAVNKIGSSGGDSGMFRFMTEIAY